MQYISKYQSPLGEILISGDEIGLTGLWFVGQKYYARCLDKEIVEEEIEILKKTKMWLDIYFSGKRPNLELPLHFMGTKFQTEVWEILCKIPYGKIMSYGEIAENLAKRRGVKKMSAQAVGSAVSHNKISIVVPCHRVIGKNGNLTGYAGGVDKKISLLKLEKSYKISFFVPNYL